jgi:hypothetical protein
MSARYIVIAAAVLVSAAALLYSADYMSFVPTTPQSTSLYQVRWRSHVDFIERYLGFSPDGGDGSVEIAMLVLIVALIGLSAFRKTTSS